MPRTTVVECPGCPPLRAISFDVLGLIKVIEVHGEKGMPQVVQRWGQPDPQLCVLATSLSNDEKNPRLGIARKNGMVEVLDPTNGAFCSSWNVGATNSSTLVHGCRPENDPIIGLHIFRRDSARENSILVCTEKGNANISSFQVDDADATCKVLDSQSGWGVCGSGSVLCCQVDGSEKYAVFGGKGVEVNTWDLEKRSKLWTAKAPPQNSMGLFTPTWVTAVTHLSKDDHRKVVIGTNQHQVRLYDIVAQRRPILSFDFREYPIKVVKEDLDGYTIYVGTGSGDLASFDMRTGKLLGSFIGKCSGSVRSIARHPELPLIASCGLDRYLRIWDVKTRQLLAAVFLKQQLTSIVIDSKFTVVSSTAVRDVADLNIDKVEPETNNIELVERNDVSTGSKRKSSATDDKKHKKKHGKRAKLKNQESKIDL